MRNKLCLPLIIIAIILVLSTVPYGANALEPDHNTGDTLSVKEWLILGPFLSPLPVFHDEGDKKLDIPYLLEFEQIDPGSLNPALNTEFTTAEGTVLKWKKITPEYEKITLPLPDKSPSTTYLATYIDLDRWSKLLFISSCNKPYAIYVDGKRVAIEKEVSEEIKESSKKVKLVEGKHLVIVKSILCPSDSTGEWTFNLKITGNVPKSVKASITTDPTCRVSLKHILNLPSPTRVAISGSGKFFALTMTHHPANSKKSDTWLEIRKTSDGKLVASIKGLKGLSGVKWCPEGEKLSYISRQKEKASLYIFDLLSGETKEILKNIKNLTGYLWSPNGKFIIYSISEEKEDRDKNVKRLRGIQDRWSYGRKRSYLYMVSVPSGITRRITAGQYSTHVYDIRGDGKAVIVSRSYEDLSERPYGTTELYEIDLSENSEELLWKGHWLNYACYSPDGKRLLIIGGPSTFGDLGRNVPENTIPNDYDGQAYIFNIKTRNTKAISKNFNPSINRGVWSKVDGMIYFVAEDSSYVRLFRYNPKRNRYKWIKTGFDCVGWASDISPNTHHAILSGSGANTPSRLYLVDLRRDRTRCIYNPNGDEYKLVKLDRVENWDFTSSTGRKIKGRVHYPPDFDPTKKYPCIVYYYGGTSPTYRSFGGRYPKNLWAAMGYIVYVLQPSGATGFGQEFSALHVNDWGKIVADEIIEGVKKFLHAHPFVDSTRVGCIGASYGGFMTQLLLTRTDIFAAAVSHAGISLIPHYWGEGYWGYAYNAVSAANSFPWNRKDIYVEQSPLFHADKITTPLLLLHGTDDTNVPTGESDQMYIALKLLHRPVEYVQIKGQNHIISNYEKRVAWTKTILAWFDLWLKDQPEWWHDLYPDSKGETDKKSEEFDEECKELPEDISSQSLQTATDKYGEMILIGNTSPQEILSYIPDWITYEEKYIPDGEIVSRIKKALPEDLSIICVLGTWCGDSRREVPRFQEVMKTCNIEEKKLKILAVDRSKAESQDPTYAELINWSKRVREYLGVKAVPTFIICSGGKELGRIVETPEVSLEEDLLQILTGSR